MVRGEEVEARNREYVERFARDDQKLREQLKINAPALLARLNPAQPAPMKCGYQLLPKIIPADVEVFRKEAKPGKSTPSFNWPKADAMLDDQLVNLKKLESGLREEHPDYNQLIDSQQWLDRNRSLTERVIQYNKVWQELIAKEIPRWNGMNKVYDDMLKNPGEMTAEGRGSSARPFFKLERPAPNETVIKVKMFTDIKDREFLKKVKSEIENFWHLEDAKGKFRVVLDLKQVEIANAPVAGQPIDVKKHLGLFPSGASILTTGTNQTYFDTHEKNGPFIVLAPTDLPGYALAHEFGHLLGLNDEYQRGYRDLGRDGYEILEMIPDTSDIMCNSNRGLPRRWHFEVISRTLSVKK